jgi:hypothetical protein
MMRPDVCQSMLPHLMPGKNSAWNTGSAGTMAFTDGFWATGVRTLHLASGTFRGYFGSCIDTTDTKRAQDAMRCDAMRRCAGFASATPNLEEVTAALRRIVTDGHRADQLIGNVRAVLTQSGSEQTPLDLNKLVREVLALAQSDLENLRVLLKPQLNDDPPHRFQ